jgi:Predicted transcriptional regulator
MISYGPLWKTLKEKQVTQYQLINNYDIDRRLLSALRANRNITVLSIERLCKALDCTPNEVLEFLDEDII